MMTPRRYFLSEDGIELTVDVHSLKRKLDCPWLPFVLRLKIDGNFSVSEIDVFELSKCFHVLHFTSQNIHDDSFDEILVL